MTMKLLNMPECTNPYDCIVAKQFCLEHMYLFQDYDIV